VAHALDGCRKETPLDRVVVDDENFGSHQNDFVPERHRSRR
jgi:hypothetical protein